ncbi:Clo7bot family Cys-rich peptide [Clostridium sporogenes]|uniref:Clo7bot family Cys-rich peptide n=2 Tax=Clostridium TaxID=1485 RepID=A0A6M0SWH1_CLOBO|nr:Clo7bot family Cys-rich peptide [Clostridium botulinum]NFI73372.1 Clo7bot family Cys-rich peptide [Clostridium sporogenes]NFL72665.1 Clo7bot family Cys-rich peptide [Clostridium sporogenes]NFM23231.1 Clo7bot family Cys-rich peptide [Clostridium sporogenes]NFN88172.1 Clo7bot family Cys-rich peptide [Clostridium sporogenes]
MMIKEDNMKYIIKPSSDKNWYCYCSDCNVCENCNNCEVNCKTY